MKKLITAIVALAMVSSMSVTAFAAEDTVINYGTENKTGSTAIEYTVAPSFTVTIPAEVELNGHVEIKAENVRVAKGKVVNVSLTGINKNDNDFKVTTPESAEINYTVTKGTGKTTNVNKGDKVLTVAPAAGGATATEQINFIAPADSTITYAGEYSGTVTFTVSVDNALIS